MQAFRLNEEHQASFSGGSVKYNMQGHLFNVGEELEKGDGLIVTDDAGLAEVLRSYPALESVSADEIPDDAQPVKVAVPDFLQTGVAGPWTPQTNDVPVGAPVSVLSQAVEASAKAMQAEQEAQSAPAPGDNAPDVPVEHADEPATVEDAIKQGEQVSGSSSSTSRR